MGRLCLRSSGDIWGREWGRPGVLRIADRNSFRGSISGIAARKGLSAGALS